MVFYMHVKAPSCSNPKCKSTMPREYVRSAYEDGKQRAASVGWWCPGCLEFENDLF